MFYCIGDIHGYSDQLERALALIEADGGADAPIVFLGDYVDRGPDSNGVIQRLMDGQAAGKPWTCLIGNHDLMFWRFMTHGIVNDAHILSGKGWLHHRLGGPNTLASYVELPEFNHPAGGGMDTLLQEGLDPTPPALLAELLQAARDRVPKAHLDWIEAQPRIHQAHGHIFVHAGIRPGISLDKQDEADLTWIRDGWLESEADHGAVVVHGHTALEFPKHHGNRINLDAGAGYGRTLVPAVCDEGDWFTLDEDGRTGLRP
ncbi:metallophosphoesterase [Octadecabacter sp. CECT 8868]|uniref:metallophosphoesterase n=1 Tax=Octadecabacter algicola TaxID=2909342 RepID=UPI001F3C46BF|nr:metallophosphoesterase [Octadecabacter algicola]MCF2905905.1 metallophosphoesterase [Octadecabacter algicola]